MYRYIVASIVLLSFFINFTGSFDAGHINPDFTKDRTHAKITECALYKITYDYLQSNYDVSSSTPIEIDNGNCKNAKNTIKALIKSLKLNYQYYYLSIKDVMQSNRLVDIKEAFTTNAHFDDESFDKAAERIQSFKYTAITYANKEDFTLSRSYFGRMLHTLQDFYSHSNWVNFEPNKINQYLGSSLNLGSIAGKTVRTCEPCETSDCTNTIVKELLDKRILTSGYFSMFSSKKEVGKCSHGGFMDKTTSQDSKGRGINKDTNGAPQADLHLKAANLAFQSTYEVLKNFWASIGNQKFGNFLGFRGTSLAICIDTTGSMSPSIQSVKKTAIGLIDDSNAFNYILSPFNDPTWGPLTVTQDPVIFAQKINKLYAYGGGDVPELFYHGVLDAVRACEPNSVLYVFTDAPAKDEYLRPTTEMLAKDKNVKINPILIVGGFKNEDTKETETTMRANFLEDYESLAWATGGFTIFSSNAYVSGVSDLIVQQQTQENIQTLFVSSLDTTDSISTSTTYKYEFVVDESVKTLYFYVSSSSTLPYQIRLLDPKDQLVTITNYTFNSPNTKSFYLTVSSHGIWKIELSSASNPFSVKVTGLSEVEATTKLYEYKENIMHPSYFELSGNPKKLSQLVVTSSFENLKSKIKSGEFSIVLNNATVLTTLSGEVENDDEFSTVITNLTVPERDFRIKVRLELENGAIVERFEPFFFMPTSFNVNLGVNANQSSVIKINETFEFEFYVENVGSVLTASVDILITDSLELLDYKKRVTLPPNNNYKETVTLRIPNDVKYEGQTDLITVSVANVLTPTDTNYETIYVQIQSRNVTFDTIPQCVILSDEFSSSCNVNGKCSNLKYWNATLKVNDTGSGLSQINTIRNDQIGQEYTVNLTYDSFNYGSQQPLFVHVTADCCSQNFDIVVSDIYGNIGKCSFEKEANLAISLRFDSCNLFLVLFVSIFIWLKD